MEMEKEKVILRYRELKASRRADCRDRIGRLYLISFTSAAQSVCPSFYHYSYPTQPLSFFQNDIYLRLNYALHVARSNCQLTEFLINLRGCCQTVQIEIAYTACRPTGNQSVDTVLPLGPSPSLSVRLRLLSFLGVPSVQACPSFCIKLFPPWTFLSSHLFSCTSGYAYLA